ncbi:MAG: M20/M25/M40 family metallo-hydrolase, partial [Planctomycetales bacterium]|nr:M20/M25/M40 family metallo-hydrolase [Planctomycetales bacterium]
MPDFTAYLDEHRQRMVDDLCQLLAIPSVSADSRHAEDVRRAAQWVAKQLSDLGLDTELVETPGHPIVYAETPPVENAPVALVYGHYDVQPPDPLDEWVSPPFEPTCRNGNVYARGATDDKGQMLTHIMSLQAWMATEGRLPLQIKFLIEGEEEVGSANIEAFLEERRQQLACDIVVISDTSQFGP